MITMTLGKKVMVCRRDLGLTQAELAERANISRSHVANIENERVTNVGVDVINDLARALDTNPQFLMGISDNPLPPYTEGLVVAEEQVIYNVEDPAIRDLLSMIEQMDAKQRRQLVEIARIIHHT